MKDNRLLDGRTVCDRILDEVAERVHHEQKGTEDRPVDTSVPHSLGSRRDRADAVRRKRAPE